LKRKISEKFNVGFSNVILGNGSDDIIGMLTRAFLQSGDEAVLPQPSFLMYEIMIRSADATPVSFPLKALCIDLSTIKDKITSKTRMVFICNPNNPTGTCVSDSEFKNFLNSIPPDIIVVMDEAYIEFVRDHNCARSIDYLRYDKALVTLRTFSKVYGLAGLRIGYGIMPEEISDILNRVRQPFNANSLAQVAALAALDDEDFLRKSRRLVHDGLDFLYGSLENMGVGYFPTQANFFLVDVKRNADEVFEAMLKQGIIVRSMTAYGYPEFIRINVGLPEENIRFIKALEKIL